MFLRMKTIPAVDGFDHVTLPIHDLDAAERFYTGVLGAKLVRRVDRETFVRLRPERAAEVDAANSPLHVSVAFHDAPHLDLFLQPNAKKTEPAPHPHVAMRVDADELDMAAARLREAGVPVDGPRRLGPPGHASIYFLDPSGNLLELVTTGYEKAVIEGPPDLPKLVW